MPSWLFYIFIKIVCDISLKQLLFLSLLSEYQKLRMKSEVIVTFFSPSVTLVSLIFFQSDFKIITSKFNYLGNKVINFLLRINIVIQNTTVSL